MPGSTTTLALPYPLATEPVSQGDDAIKSLAEAVEAAMKGADGAFTPGTSISVNAAGVYRRGRMVAATLNIFTTAAVASGAVIGTVPTGFRPTVADWRGTLVNFNTGANLGISVESGGNIIARGAISSGHTVVGSVVWPL